MLPTPAVAFLTADLGADLGVVISASHNPMPDNGIKFFARGGHKLADELEDAIEARLRENWAAPDRRGRRADPPGRRRPASATSSTCSRRLPHRLDGLTVVVDCAHGAASVVAPEVLRRAGAEVVAIGAAPDGLNINDGCRLDPPRPAARGRRRARRRRRASRSTATPTAASRSTPPATVVDGDQILAILALAMREAGRLPHDTVVATVMSQPRLPASRWTARASRCVETAVGDRYVLEAMRAGGFALGGEQSGHVIMLDHATTGDGMLTALQLLGPGGRDRQAARRARRGAWTGCRRCCVNVPRRRPGAASTRCAPLQAAVASAEAELGATGRVLLRPSGTEPLVRVMVEASDKAQADAVAARLAEVVKARPSL